MAAEGYVPPVRTYAEHIIPNLLEGQVRHVTFDNVTIAGVSSIADAFRGPSFNVSSTGSVSDIYVDGRKVI